MRNSESFLEHGELIDSETVDSAQKYFAIAEEAAKVTDKLARKILEKNPVTLEDLMDASFQIRHTVFNRGCDILGLTEQQRQEIIENT